MTTSVDPRRCLRAIAVLLCACVAAPAASSTPDHLYSGACDGSAAAILPNGRLVGGNDENNSLRIYRLSGGAPRGALDLETFLRVEKEADIEAAARSGRRIYWITSHGRKKNGDEKPDRLRFFATDWTSLGLKSAAKWRSDLLKPLLGKGGIAALRTAEPLAPEKGGINIEALAPAPAGALLIGFRSPLVNKNALVIRLKNPDAVLRGAAPRFGTQSKLDLGGRGVRDMIAFQGGYLLIAGPVADGGPFDLYRWSGRDGDSPRKVNADLGGLSPEGLVPLNSRSVLVLSDDGSDECKALPAAKQSFRGRVIVP
jgi:hypothetical protein